MCCDCEHWDWRFETDSLLMGYCNILKKLVEGVLQPEFNGCILV